MADGIFKTDFEPLDRENFFLKKLITVATRSGNRTLVDLYGANERLGHRISFGCEFRIAFEYFVHAGAVVSAMYPLVGESSDRLHRNRRHQRRRATCR